MKHFIHFFKGIFIGIAAVIPGLSGSIFAVVVGLYDKMVEAVSTLFRRSHFRKNLVFLLPILLGVGVGVLLSTKAVLWVCENYTGPSYAFFIGMVLGSLPLIFKKTSQSPFRFWHLTLSCITCAILVGITLWMGTPEDSSMVAISAIVSWKDALIVVGAGMFSCALMAIPGVSGSVMLMVIHQYGTVYHAVSNLTESFAAWPIVGLFAFGAIIGFLGIAKLLHWLLEHASALTYYGVAGLIGGAVFALFYQGILPVLQQLQPVYAFGQSFVFLGFALLGYLIVRRQRAE